MSNTKFTKGDWVKIKGKPYVYSLNKGACNRWQLEIVGNFVVSNEELEANAHLIAAAPEMYAMLDTIATNMYKRGGGTIKDILAIETLLAKARGEQQ